MLTISQSSAGPSHRLYIEGALPIILDLIRIIRGGPLGALNIFQGAPSQFKGTGGTHHPLISSPAIICLKMIFYLTTPPKYRCPEGLFLRVWVSIYHPDALLANTPLGEKLFLQVSLTSCTAIMNEGVNSTIFFPNIGIFHNRICHNFLTFCKSHGNTFTMK